MTDSESQELVQRLRALRVAPPRSDFEASLQRSLSAPELASNVRPGPWLTRRATALPAAAAALLIATSAAALIGQYAAPALHEPAPSREPRAPAAADPVRRAIHAPAQRAPEPVKVEVEQVQSPSQPDPIEPSMPQDRPRPHAARRSAVQPVERPADAQLSQELRALSSQRVDLRAPSASELLAPERGRSGRAQPGPSEFDRSESGKAERELRSKRMQAREIRREPEGARQAARVTRDANPERGTEREWERERERGRDRERERGRDQDHERNREGERDRR